MITPISLTPIISYFPASSDPLSAEVVVISGKKSTYFYDVGCNNGVLDYIEDIHNYSVILSHFHRDHIENIHKLTPDELYVSKQTHKYTHSGIIVDKAIEIDDGPLHLKIFPIPCSHSKGCLGLEVNREFAFIGDSMYGNINKPADSGYNYQLTQQAIQAISEIEAKNIYLSHRFPTRATKKGVLSFLEEHLSK